MATTTGTGAAGRHPAQVRPDAGGDPRRSPQASSSSRATTGRASASVAAAARIDPSMVMRYYGSKQGLFAAAAHVDLLLPDLSGVSPTQARAGACSSTSCVAGRAT